MAVARVFVLLALLILQSAGQYNNPLFANTSGAASPAIDLDYIKVQGTVASFGDYSARAWLGIRYAQNPTGALRLGPPLAIEDSFNPSQVFDGTKFGPICYQGQASAYQGDNAVPEVALGIGDRKASEDCLLLDIYAPKDPASNRLPVLLYIHGAGYVQGCSTTGVRPGDILASLPGQVIVVSIQYRLSGFGFLGGAQIADSGGLNAGLQDQRLAIDWVQRHISSFGGDPDRVVLDGGSAGGGSVILQLLWNGGERNPPYHAAMAEFPGIPTMLNSSQLEVQYQQVLSAANCPDVNCLRSFSGEEFNQAQQKVLTQDTSSYAYGLFYYAPYVDGNFIRSLPSNDMSWGNIATVPLMTSRDGNEGHIFTPPYIRTTADYEAHMHSLFNGGINFFGQLDYLYPTSSPPGPYAYNSTHQRAEWVIGDAFIACVSEYAASSLTNRLSNVDKRPAVWKFIWAYPSYSTAYHGSYYPYVYTAHYYNATENSTEARTARVLTHYFSSFILHSNPNIGASRSDSSYSPWREYGAESNVMLIGSNGAISKVIDPDIGPRCQFWQAHSSEYAV